MNTVAPSRFNGWSLASCSVARLCLPIALIGGMAANVQAIATSYYRLDTATTLDLAGAWSGGPPGAGDVAAWNSTPSAANCVIGAANNVNLNWGGISATNAPTATVVIPASGTSTLTLGASGISWTSASARELTITCPLVIDASQFWTANPSRTLTINGASMTLTGGCTLTLSGNNTFTLSAPLASTGGLTKNGTGAATLSGNNSGYSGLITVGGGVLRINHANALGTGNLTLNGGVAEGTTNYNTFAQALNSTAGTLQLIGGTNGFSAFGSAVNVNLDSGATVVWGSAYFTPTTLMLNSSLATAELTFQNALDLSSGSTRTIQVDGNAATISGLISNSNGSPGGLTKTGPGTLVLGNAGNTFFGNININAGVLRGNDGTHIPAGQNINIGAGVWETGGDITRGLGTGNNQVQLTASPGGFSAVGGPVTVNLSSGAALVWGTASFAPVNNLTLNSANADSVITLQNDLSFNTANPKTITVNDNAVTNGDYAVLSGSIGGSIGWTKAGAGTLRISSTNNTFTGKTAVSAGILEVAQLAPAGNNSSLGAPAAGANATIDLGATSVAGTLRYIGAGPATTDRAINLAGTTGANAGGIIENNGGGDLTFTANPFNTALGGNVKTIILGGTQGGAIQGVIQNGTSGSINLTKTGSGTWALSNAANTYAGKTTIVGGVLSIGTLANAGVASSIGQYATAGAAGLLLQGGTLNYTGVSGATTDRGFTTSVTNNTINLPNNSTTLTMGACALGALTTAFTGYSGNSLTLGAITPLGGAIIDVASDLDVTLGAMGGSDSGFIKQGLGRLILNTASTRTSDTVVTLTAGTLKLGVGGSPDSLGTSPNAEAITLNGGTLDLASDTPFSFPHNLAVRGTATIASGRATDGDAITNTFGTLKIYGAQLNVTVGGHVPGTAGLTFGDTTLYTGVAVVDVAGGANLTLGKLSGQFPMTKQGSGQLTLNTAGAIGARKAPDSTVTLSAGTIKIGDVAAMGAAGVPIVLNGGKLDLAIDASVNAHPTTVGGDIEIASGRATGGTGITNALGTLSIGTNTLRVTAGVNVTSGTAGLTFAATTLTGNPTIDTASGTLLTLGALGDGGVARTITKSGAGTLTLGTPTTNLIAVTAVNIAGGTLNANNATALGSLAAVDVADGATFNLTVSSNGNTVFSGAISGSGSLTKVGPGALTLSGANLYTGATTVSNGTLRLTGSLASPVTVQAGGAFEGTGSTTGAVTNNSGGTLAPGTNGIGTLASGALTLNSGSTNIFEFAADGSTNDFIDASAGALTINSNDVIHLYNVGTTTPFTKAGTYNLIKHNGTVIGDPASLVAADPVSGVVYSFDNDGTYLRLIVTGQPAPTALAFTTQPGGAEAGSVFTSPPVATVLNEVGGVASQFAGQVSIAIGANPGGGTLSGTTNVAAVAGVATFSGLSIDQGGTNYTLVAAAAGLTSATSGTFTIAPLTLAPVLNLSAGAYTQDADLTVNGSFEFDTNLDLVSLEIDLDLPAGWTATNAVGVDGSPNPDITDIGLGIITYTDPALGVSPIKFALTLHAPTNATGAQSLYSQVGYWPRLGYPNPIWAAGVPNPLILEQAPAVVTIIATAGIHGSVAPSGTVVVTYGGATNFVVSADLYYHIDSIVTNGVPVPGVTGLQTFTSQWQNVTATGSMAAAFAENLGSHGTPEWWLAQYGWTNNFEAAETGDPDHDGMSTWQEYVAGTDPISAVSRFVITHADQVFGTNYTEYVYDATTNPPPSEWVPPPSEWVTQRVYEVIGEQVTWSSVSGRVYDLVYATNLLRGGWADLDGASNLTGRPPENTFTNMTPSYTNKDMFYRVRVGLP